MARGRGKARVAGRAWLGAAAGILVLLAALAPGLGSAAPWEPPTAVYMPQTGHHLEGSFLTFWRRNGRAALLGNPVTEQRTEGDLTVQYFEKARLEYRPDGTIVLGRLGSESVEARGLDRQRTWRRATLRTDPELQREDDPFARLPSSRFPASYNTGDHRFFRESGHTLGNSFKLFWEEWGDLEQFGYPISEELREVSPVDGQEYTVQYFERARFEYHPDSSRNWGVVLTPLGLLAAQARGVDTGAVARDGGVPNYDEVLFSPPPTPTPTPQPTATQVPLPAPTPTMVTANAPLPTATSAAAANATGATATPTAVPPRPTATPTSTPVATGRGGPRAGGKLIDVDLSDQYLTAYEGDVVVWAGYISSGKRGWETPTGTYSIFSKLRVEDMRGNDPALEDGVYFQPAVPWVMYFAGGGFAIHGVYWHSAFGSPRSHGCVGLPVGAASVLYDWAPIGTTVYIHY